MTDDLLASTLAGIKSMITERDALAARINWDAPDDITAFNTAQDKVAGRVPSLVAAVEAVLKLADPEKSTGVPPVRIRKAITAALTGEDGD